MSVKVFLSVSLILGDLCVVKIDVRLQRFVLMSVLYCLLKTPCICFFFFFKKKEKNQQTKMSEHFSTFTQRWVHLPSPLLFAVTHVELSLVPEVQQSNQKNLSIYSLRAGLEKHVAAFVLPDKAAQLQLS